MREIVVRGPAPPWAESPTGRRGAGGEEAVAAHLRDLDDGYVLVRNLTLPGSAGDVDGVLLTPANDLWVLEIKAFAAWRDYRCRDRLWEYRQESDDPWRPLEAQPSRQALFHARQVQGALRDAGLPASPRPAVVLAGEARVALERPRVPVVTARELRALLAAPGQRARDAAAGALQEATLGALLRAARR